jgi:hypothetical protein
MEPAITTQTKPGHSGTRKVRVVCQKCNGGWMSALEAQAKPLLLPLINGENGKISVEAQRVLATWASKTVMTAEFIHPKSAVIEVQERKLLMEHLLPPERWHVWMARYEGEVWRGLSMYQHSGTLDVPSVSRPGGVSHYVESTTFGIGHVVFYVVATTWERIHIPFLGFGVPGLARICPAPNLDIVWPPPFILGDAEVTRMSQSVGEILLSKT